MRHRPFWLLGLLPFLLGAALPPGLIEPKLSFAPPSAGVPTVALTLDACSGKVDWRIIDTLIAQHIKATIFVTGRWIAANPQALGTLVAHPDLFELEDHGLNHIPAIVGSAHPYGLLPAGTVAGVKAEVEGGAERLRRVAGVEARWYRGAAALYTADAMAAITSEGLRVAGFSLNADFGASVSQRMAAQRMQLARSGDVIIAHVNQPDRPAGAGIAEGIIALKQKGFRFVTLSEALPG